LPKPTINDGGKVPDRSPRSYPPPLISGIILIFGFLRIYRAPTPFGP
jgi:hypothetical protein